MTATERHYTPKEIAEMWQVHIQTVHRTFREGRGTCLCDVRYAGTGCGCQISAFEKDLNSTEPARPDALCIDLRKGFALSFP